MRRPNKHGTEFKYVKHNRCAHTQNGKIYIYIGASHMCDRSLIFGCYHIMQFTHKLMDHSCDYHDPRIQLKDRNILFADDMSTCGE